MVKRLLVIVIAAGLISAAYLYMERNDSALAVSSVGAGAPAGEVTATADNKESPKPSIGASFEGLVNEEGKTVTNADFSGHKMLVFFGFTHCPDICPVSMAVITEVMNQLETANITNVIPVFITVDPERDTPEVLKNYLKDYHNSIIGLTGPAAKLEEVEKGYKVYAAKAEEEDAKGHGDHKEQNYMVSHSDLIYYMGADGNYLSHFNRDNAPEDIVDYITSH